MFGCPAETMTPPWVRDRTRSNSSRHTVSHLYLMKIEHPTLQEAVKLEIEDFQRMPSPKQHALPNNRECRKNTSHAKPTNKNESPHVYAKTQGQERPGRRRPKHWGTAELAQPSRTLRSVFRWLARFAVWLRNRRGDDISVTPPQASPARAPASEKEIARPHPVLAN